MYLDTLFIFEEFHVSENGRLVPMATVVGALRARRREIKITGCLLHGPPYQSNFSTQL